MKRHILPWASIVAFLGGCRAGVVYWDEPPGVPPVVVSTDPAANSAGLPGDTNIAFTFSEAMQATPGAVELSTGGSFALAWDAGGTTLTIDPDGALPAGGRVTVTLGTDFLDVNDGLGGEGPMSPERAGSMPGFALVDYCFSGTVTKEEVKKKLVGKGGILDLLGTTDMLDLEKRYVAGEAEVVTVMDAMAYRVAKEIAGLWPAFDGEPVDQILITGGLARCKPTVAYIKKCLAGMPTGITVYPGENEMLALVKGALRVLSGREAPKEYAPQA